MMETVAIRGYRSPREVVLPLGRLSIVTGENGAGKSSLYRALRLLADCGRGDVVGSLAREGGLESVLWAGPELGRSTCVADPHGSVANSGSSRHPFAFAAGVPPDGARCGSRPDSRRR